MGEEGAEYCQITLQPKLASAAAKDLYGQLAGHREDTLVLDASKVEQMGVLCMQILVSAAKSWTEAGKSFEVVDPSAAFRDSADIVGLDLTLMGVEKSEESAGGS